MNSYETENGIQAQESGEVKGTDEEGTIESVTGSYSYVAPDGQRITVNYIADENGKNTYYKLSHHSNHNKREWIAKVFKVACSHWKSYKYSKTGITSNMIILIK